MSPGQVHKVRLSTVLMSVFIEQRAKQTGNGCAYVSMGMTTNRTIDGMKPLLHLQDASII